MDWSNRSNLCSNLFIQKHTVNERVSISYCGHKRTHTQTQTHTSIKFSIYLTEITWCCWWWWWEFSFCINEFPEKTLSGIRSLSRSFSQSVIRLMVCKIGKSLPQAQSQILWKSLNRMAAWIDCFLCATSTIVKHTLAHIIYVGFLIVDAYLPRTINWYSSTNHKSNVWIRDDGDDDDGMYVWIGAVQRLIWF